MEVATITGHRDLRMLRRYTHCIDLVRQIQSQIGCGVQIARLRNGSFESGSMFKSTPRKFARKGLFIMCLQREPAQLTGL